MAYKSSGTAAKSSSGASMSKFDVEIDARVSALEKAVKELQSHSHDVPATSADGGDHEMLVNLEQTLRDSGVI